MFIPNEANKIRNSLDFLIKHTPQKVALFLYNLKHKYNKLLNDGVVFENQRVFNLHGEDVQHLHVNIRQRPQSNSAQ